MLGEVFLTYLRLRGATKRGIFRDEALSSVPVMHFFEYICVGTLPQ